MSDPRQTWNNLAATLEDLRDQQDEPEQTCRLCQGTLIGTELEYGTCGHCGGRSVR